MRITWDTLVDRMEDAVDTYDDENVRANTITPDQFAYIHRMLGRTLDATGCTYTDNEAARIETILTGVTERVRR